MLCAKFGLNWPSGSGEEDENVKSLWQRQWPQQQRRWTMDKFWSEKLTWAFGSGELKSHNYTSTLVTKIVEVVSPFVSSFVKIEIPFTQFQLKIPWWFWRRFLRVRFSPFSYYLHFKKDMAIHLNKLAKLECNLPSGSAEEEGPDLSIEHALISSHKYISICMTFV